MTLFYLREAALSSRARELIEFDADSIRMMTSAAHAAPPETWLVDPERYEKGGRILRDSTTPRLLAYSAPNRTLYVTDGCNSCSHVLPEGFEGWTPDQAGGFSEETGIPQEMVARMAALLSGLS